MEFTKSHDISLAEHCAALYGRKIEDVRIVRAPARVCPLGAHVDHQLGIVTGWALDKGVYVAFIPRDDQTVRVRSLSYDDDLRCTLNSLPLPKKGWWGNYVMGSLQALRKTQSISRGFDGLVAGTLPSGGLGTSAAVGIAYLMAAERSNNLTLSPMEIINLHRICEHEYLGLQNGVLDQSIILRAQSNTLTFLDCRDHSYRAVPCAAGSPPVTVIIAYSGISTALPGTSYNVRVQECREAARLLLRSGGLETPQHVNLRAVPLEIFEEYKHQLPSSLRKRASHFFGEYQRVHDAIPAWQRGDFETLGSLMSESGESSRSLYECGSRELSALFDILCSTKGVCGARFSGAGFRGSCVAITTICDVEALLQEIIEQYRRLFPELANSAYCLQCQISDGARIT